MYTLTTTQTGLRIEVRIWLGIEPRMEGGMNAWILCMHSWNLRYDLGLKDWMQSSGTEKRERVLQIHQKSKLFRDLLSQIHSFFFQSLLSFFQNPREMEMYKSEFEQQWAERSSKSQKWLTKECRPVAFTLTITNRSIQCWDKIHKSEM